MFDDSEVFIRKNEAARRFGVTVRSIERWEKAGIFPRRVQLGPFAVAYRASELKAFAESRRYTEPKSPAARAPAVA